MTAHPAGMKGEAAMLWNDLRYALRNLKKQRIAALDSGGARIPAGNYSWNL